MAAAQRQIDEPEPCWQAILALCLIGGIYAALPKTPVLRPTWLLPAIIVVVLVPTIFAHRAGWHSLNHSL